MNILAIETSCDETAVSVVLADGDFPKTHYEVLGNALFSQVDIHREYGGVFPSLAKREHAKTLVPMLEKALQEAQLAGTPYTLEESASARLNELLSREPGLSDALTTYLTANERPDIDLIAVTSGPGLEPALWVGLNFAKALSVAWNIPLVPSNHMEGHILSALFNGETLGEIRFPALALLISGGHTEIVLVRDWGMYELVGQTRDDAVGEAFDKVARTLDLPYPGGPEISKLAEKARAEHHTSPLSLPRPMIASADCDFSFSGLKTAVLHAVAKYKEQNISHETYATDIAQDFENAVAEVLVAKVRRALDLHNAETLILGGGVSANTHIRREFKHLFESEYPDHLLYLPEAKLTTDNAVMIALAAHSRFALDQKAAIDTDLTTRADGNLSLHS